MGRSGQNWLLLGILSLGWGSSFLFQDVAVEEIPPLTVTAARLGVAAAALTGVMLAMGRRLPWALRPWLFFLALGTIGNLLPFALITWAQGSVKSGVAGILVAVVPLITLVLAHFFVPQERMTRRRVLGFLLGFLGVVALLGPRAIGEDGDGTILAYAALLGGAFCFAANAVIAARMPDLPPIVAASGVLLAAAFVTTPVALAFVGLGSRNLTLDATGSVAVLAFVITPGATYAYFRLVRSTGPTFLSLFNYFNPLVAVFCGVVVLNERIGAEAFIALGLIFAGVTVSELGRRASAAGTSRSPAR